MTYLLAAGIWELGRGSLHLVWDAELRRCRFFGITSLLNSKARYHFGNLDRYKDSCADMDPFCVRPTCLPTHPGKNFALGIGSLALP